MTLLRAAKVIDSTFMSVAHLRDFLARGHEALQLEHRRVVPEQVPHHQHPFALAGETDQIGRLETAQGPQRQEVALTWPSTHKRYESSHGRKLGHRSSSFRHA